MSNSEKKEKENTKLELFRSGTNFVGRVLGVVVMLGLFLWYCEHPEYYGDGRVELIFTLRRSYLILISTMIVIGVCLVPNRLSEKMNRMLAWIWLAVSPIAVYFSLYYMNAKKFKIHFLQLNRIAVVFTFWFLIILVLFFLVVTGSIRASVIIMAVLIALIGIANRFIIAFRGTAISGADLFSIGTAMTVADNYTYEINWDIFSEIYLTTIICILSFKLRGFKVLCWKMRVLVLALWAMLAGSFYHICCKTSYLENNDIRSWGFTHQLRYKQFDMLFTTLCTCFYLSVDKPDGYSLKRVEEIAADYIDESDRADEDFTPNIIVVMNESFADYTDIGQGLKYSSDPMPFIHSLTENTIKGNAYASIFGANTPNSEYEFLTGNTMGFLPPTSVGFNLFVRGNMPSLASELKSAGYGNLAMHPYRGTNYRRNIVYPQIGFDTYYDRRYFFSPDHIRQYISDQALADRIMREYRRHKNNTDGEPFFSYNVTVQNHGGYTSSNSKNLSSRIHVLTQWIDRIPAQQHANLVKASDDAFKSLVDYFSGIDEPVVLIMFGDHQANIGDATYAHLLGNEDTLSPEELMEKYKIPFVCWANYDIEEEVITKTSLNYLYSILADKLNLPMTGYQKYLVDLSEKYPVLAAGGYWAADGTFYELNDKTSPYYEDINDYNILEYNYIFGKENRCMDLFALKENGD